MTVVRGAVGSVGSRPKAGPQAGPVEPERRATWPGRADALEATGRLARLILRRDRLRLVLWVVGLVALMAVSAQSVTALYDSPTSIETYVRTVGGNPALIVFAGPGYGFDDPNVGVILVNETSLWMALGCALMSVFLVNRHTRAEEESGRAELIRSAVVGRHAPVAATLIVAAGANLAVAAGSAAVTLAFGYPLAGTLAQAAGFGLVGLSFAAVTAVAVQMVASGRAALGLGTGLVGVAFVVRGIGDIGAAALAWATPFGWGIGVRAFAGERWWTLAGLAAFTVVALAAAVVLSVRRDLGSGLLAPRPGPASAPGWVRTPLGLVFRLQRASLVAWATGLFVAGLVYGSVADDVEAMVEDNPQLADYLALVSGATLTDSYLAVALRMLGLVVAGFAVASALRARADEAAGHAEPMLSAAVSRWWWAGSHLVVTLAGTLLLSTVAGLGVGVGYATAVGEWTPLGTLALASLAPAAAVLVLVGAATVLFGWWPRATSAAWAALAFAVVIEVLATVLRLPRWVTLASPLTHVPSIPAQDWDPVSLVVLVGVASGLTAIGLAGFRRRDLAPG